jgi:hypothetical protein
VGLPVSGVLNERAEEDDGVLWLEGGVQPDPWLLRCAMEDAVVTDVRPDASERGNALDAAWTSVLDIGKGSARFRERERMRVQMGRYGHQDMMGWDDVELTEFFRLYRDLADLMGKESTLHQATEDG